MRFFSAFRTLLAFVFRRSRAEREMDEEFRSHLESRADALERRGLARAEAERQARLEFGGYQRYKEECREALGPRLLAELIADVRYGIRQLRRSPGFTLVAVFTLALGIGATTAIFSVFDSVLLHHTPYRNPTKLVSISAESPQGEADLISPGDFQDWQEQSRVFESLAAYKQWDFRTLTGGGEPDEVWVSPVSSNLFRLLVVGAAIGRTFATHESLAIILSYQYWRSHFASDRSVVGKTLALDGTPYTVMGIAPADLEFPSPNTQIWIPLTFTGGERNDRENRSLHVIARLKTGVTLKQAQVEMDLLARRLAMQYPKTNAGWSAPVEPFEGREIKGVLRAAILALMSAVVFVLMIVCANVSSILLARGASRQAEMAIRAALGAGRLRLVRQLLIESILLAGSASLGGLVLAWWALALIVSLVPKYNLVETQALHRVAINLPVLGCTVALSLLTGIVVGLLPALRISRVDINESLKERGRVSPTGGRRSHLQRVLVISELALALVLLIGAGLMIESFERLQAVPTGFNPDHLLTVRVPLMNYKYKQGPLSSAFYRELLDRIKAIPGVRAVGMANNLPFVGFHNTGVIYWPPASSGVPKRVITFALRGVSPGYFQAMEIPLKKGREFTPADTESSARCVRMINEAMARRYWPGEDPVGKLLYGACPKSAPAVIVGLVADSKQYSVDSQPEPEVYEPYAQHPFASFMVTFVIRTASDPLQLADAVRRAVWEADRSQPVIQLRTMENVISESIWQQHMSASMLGIFAVIALLLASVGIYGVLSYVVSQRTREIGIRAALGATQREILRMVVGEGLLLTSIGLGIGTLAALALTRLLASVLYGVRPKDPFTFAGLSLLLAGVSAVATYIPARRAAKVDPMAALRYE